MVKIIAGLASGLFLLGLTEMANANFVGAYSTTNYFDSNIQDGLTIS